MSKFAKIRLILLGVLLAFLSIFQMGYSNAFPNTAISGFRDFLNESFSPPNTLSENEYNWIWSAILNVYFIGFAAGSLLTVPIADKIGRKSCLLLGNSLNLLSAFVSVASFHFSLPLLFFAYRFLFAVSAAISMNSLILLLQESSPPSIRGVMSFNAEMSFVVMNLAGGIAGMKSFWGQNLFALLTFPCLIIFCSIIVVLFYHESPKFLLLCKNNVEASRKSLKFYQRLENESLDYAISKIEEENKVKKNSEVKKNSLKELLTNWEYLKGFILGVMTLHVTLSLWPMLYYSTEFLTRANISNETAELMSNVMLFVSSFSTLLGMFIVESLPRRFLLLSTAVVNVSSVLIFSLFAHFQYLWDPLKYGCIIALIVWGLSYSIALGPIAWFLTAELVPLDVRAAAVSLSLCINQLTALVFCFVTLPLYSAFGMKSTFY
ncbi:hypothetical protein WR25_02030 isoform D [Diploscapter pachys]|nr:hypothetical protein WR25_02030 isoform D [Diploscapter pachys]